MAPVLEELNVSAILGALRGRLHVDPFFPATPNPSRVGQSSRIVRGLPTYPSEIPIGRRGACASSSSYTVVKHAVLLLPPRTCLHRSAIGGRLFALGDMQTSFPLFTGSWCPSSKSSPTHSESHTARTCTDAVDNCLTRKWLTALLRRRVLTSPGPNEHALSKHCKKAWHRLLLNTVHPSHPENQAGGDN